MRAELLDVDDPRWASFLEATRHDFYHLPAYVALAAGHEDGDPAALLVTEGGAELLQPVIVRAIPGGGHDATTPYGYPGPLVRGSEDPAFLSAALAAGVSLLADRGIVSLFVRLHPILNRTLPQGVGTLVRGGDTVSIDLTLPPEEQWRQTRGNHRVHINRAQRRGRVMQLDDAWAHGEEFMTLYRGTMARVAATPYYLFGDGYLEGLRAALGERLRLSVVEADGKVAAAALWVETCGIVQYHLSASDRDFAREGLTKVVIDGVRRWAAARGDEVLHLGGGTGSGEDDPLFHFKAGFSERRHAFHTLRVVVDAAAYARLVDRHPDGDAGTGFFPAYRAPRHPHGEAPPSRRPAEPPER